MTGSYRGISTRTWHYVSITGSFPVITFVTAAIIAYQVAGTFQQAMIYTGVFLLFFSILPAAALLVFLRTGHVSDIEVRDREERDPLFLIGLAGSIGGLAVLQSMQVPELVLRLGIVQVVLVLIVFFINRSWKISIHTTAWGACLTALYLAAGPVTLVLAPLAVPVALSRFALDCHTRAQVAAGFVLGIAITALVFFRPV